MTTAFRPAKKLDARLRMAIVGPAKSGKTFSSLAIACALGKRVGVIDTERGSASKYADMFPFEVLELDSYDPLRYVAAIHDAESAGFDVLNIDSLSHAWAGKDGALEQVDRRAAKSKSGSKFNAWADVTPKQHALIDAILGCRCHVIATMRCKTEWALEPDRDGKLVPRKIGLAPVQRDGIDYEFDIVGDIDLEHRMSIAGSRCPALDGAVIDRPGAQLAETILQWLSGEPDLVDRLRTSILIAQGKGVEALELLKEQELKTLPEGPERERVKRLYQEAWKAASRAANDSAATSSGGSTSRSPHPSGSGTGPRPTGTATSPPSRGDATS